MSEVRDDKIVGIELNVNVNGEPVNVPEITPGMFKTYVPYKLGMCQIIIFHTYSKILRCLIFLPSRDRPRNQ